MSSLRAVLFMAMVFSMIPAVVLATDMVITGVIDGPLAGGTPKAVELYAITDIPDLTLYGLGSANNGNGGGVEEFTFPAGSASAGQFIYVASESTMFNAWFGFFPDHTSGALLINGDDAIELFKSSAVIDVFGDVNTDGTGTAWEYMDGWAYRVDETGPDGSNWTIGNWTFSGVDALDGETDNASAVTPFPTGTYNRSVSTLGITWGRIKKLYEVP